MSNKEIFTLVAGGGILMGLGYWLSRIEKKIPERIHQRPKVSTLSKNLPKKKPYILLLGDSITEYSFDTTFNGWGASLAYIYRHRADILNRGFSGYNSRFLLESLKLLYPENCEDLPILTILMCGTNDASIESNKIQHIDIDEFDNNMKNIIEYLLKLKSNMKIIVLTPTPVDDITYKNYCASMNQEQLRSNDIMSVYSERVMKLRNKISNNKNVFMIDLFNGIQQNEDWQSYLRDGVHPASKGNEYIYKEIISTIKTKFPLLDPENINGLQPYTFDCENVYEYIKTYQQNYLGELKILE